MLAKGCGLPVTGVANGTEGNKPQNRGMGITCIEIIKDHARVILRPLKERRDLGNCSPVDYLVGIQYLRHLDYVLSS